MSVDEKPYLGVYRTALTRAQRRVAKNLVGFHGDGGVVKSSKGKQKARFGIHRVNMRTLDLMQQVAKLHLDHFTREIWRTKQRSDPRRATIVMRDVMATVRTDPLLKTICRVVLKEWEEQDGPLRAKRAESAQKNRDKKRVVKGE